MKKKEALSCVASMLAAATAKHIEAAIQVPCLKENTHLAYERNLEIAIALNIKATYKARLSIYWNIACL